MNYECELTWLICKIKLGNEGWEAAHDGVVVVVCVEFAAVNTARNAVSVTVLSRQSPPSHCYDLCYEHTPLLASHFPLY